MVANLVQLDGLFASDERHTILKVKVGLAIVIEAAVGRVEITLIQ